MNPFRQRSVIYAMALCGVVVNCQALALTRLEYAKQCAAEMGQIPPFNCLSGALLEITKNGVPQTMPTDVCDKPVQLGLKGEGQCVPYSRLMRLQTSNTNVETVAICRKYQKSTGPDDPMFHDIAMIQHNRSTGHTCFFQSPPNVPLDGRVVPSPSAATPEASQYWLEPEADGPGGIRCTSCHSADPFIWSPYVAQKAEVKKWNPQGNWVSNFANLFGEPALTFEPDNNACVDCHRIGNARGCGVFPRKFTTEDKFQATSPKAFWMPPHFNRAPDVWQQMYGEALAQIERCCANPALAECKTTRADGGGPAPSSVSVPRRLPRLEVQPLYSCLRACNDADVNDAPGICRACYDAISEGLGIRQ